MSIVGWIEIKFGVMGFVFLENILMVVHSTVTAHFMWVANVPQVKIGYDTNAQIYVYPEASLIAQIRYTFSLMQV